MSAFLLFFMWIMKLCAGIRIKRVSIRIRIPNSMRNKEANEKKTKRHLKLGLFFSWISEENEQKKLKKNKTIKEWKKVRRIYPPQFFFAVEELPFSSFVLPFYYFFLNFFLCFIFFVVNFSFSLFPVQFIWNNFVFVVIFISVCVCAIVLTLSWQRTLKKGRPQNEKRKWCPKKQNGCCCCHCRQIVSTTTTTTTTT